MQYIKIIDVDDKFIDDLWAKVENTGTIFLLSDGYSKELFRSLYYNSNLVVSYEDGIMRVEVGENVIDIHLLALGHRFFHGVNKALEELCDLVHTNFPNKPIVCMIPTRMKSFRNIAELSGMIETGSCDRKMSGVVIPCTIFTWRKQYGF